MNKNQLQMHFAKRTQIESLTNLVNDLLTDLLLFNA